ncbi:fructose-bisphosphatase class III [Suicoccus acidiformans]|uniref:Fructose-1,6-bisphosphatase class 3 n=1 Tax=Suicoccus acidiformans TaxID=2036206 RepID=A0A347WMV5_9LACT|nr:fructose-1,6-bisphosphatase [Suicoccus acidiformans]AXY26412.1 fructose-bisphosphatase class III [Suicoccus acidiformans]
MRDMRESEVLTEIINLKSIQQLPKATEHFISDLHGEFEAFDHILRNCSGIIRIKVASIFNGELTEDDQRKLCYTIYYPEEMLDGKAKKADEWLILLNQLVRVTRHVSSKYTRSKVRKALPSEYAYVMEELLYQYDEVDNKQDYFNAIYQTIIDLNLAYHFAVTLAYLIQRFVVDHLHVLGDIYDRGPQPDAIMDKLMEVPSIDIQLGNHDIIWIGAYSGSLACLAVVLRISLRYGHLSLLEDGYGIELSRLEKYAEKYYEDNSAFRPRGLEKGKLSEAEQIRIAKMHQAISIIQFKLEGQLIDRQPDFDMQNRKLLHCLSEDRQSIVIEGQSYPLHNGCFQLVDPEAPYELTLGEELVIMDLLNQFQRSERLGEHMDFLVREGELYSVYNGNLLYHGCIPCNDDGTFKQFTFEGQNYEGRSLMTFYHTALLNAYDFRREHDTKWDDLVWYLWCGEVSTLFGKDNMRTFERYFIKDKALHKEVQNIYYQLRKDEDFCRSILQAFELDESGYIINGHTPVKAMEGENPIKANGKMLVIDGGLSKAYQKVTGIAGYTLVDNSHEVYLAAHHPFTSKADAIKHMREILPEQKMVHIRDHRVKVAETDIGHSLEEQIQALENYFGMRDGTIDE